MVAKISSGTSISRLLNYNEQKVQTGDALLLDAVGFRSNEISMDEKLAVFYYHTNKNKTTQKHAVHITLNFDEADQVDTLKLRQIASDYMEKIGFEDQPYLLYQHYDAGHKHVHIVTTNIQENGKAINQYYIGRDKSEPARKELEKQYDLVEADSKKQTQPYLIKPLDLEKVEYGKTETKRAISNIVREVVKTYKYGSLAELNAVLLQFNITADRGNPESRTYPRGGLYYSIIDNNGFKVGMPIKASSIYGRPILKNLEKNYGKNKEERYGNGLRLQKILDKAIAELNPPTKRSLSEKLKAQNIQVVYRSNEQGRLYGITYVDHASRSVFNGSALGKQYSANAMSEKLSDVAKTASNPITTTGTLTQDKANIPAPEKGDSVQEQDTHGADVNINLNLKGLLDILTAEATYEEDIDFHFKRRKKQKR